ncbi:hypothetical protein KKC83_03120 [Patescibacteria group bacterium]|nr:hypothetical protein [Candidatus Falkowbacteria bacterium]MBU3906614.1 hypothetical protein [Patescibacteria group bacterium]MBU4015537.1 hypothetical protein [Patescibacteria group bacterium]MBU4026505.1 hypothetical protein [Patescibacteria group bacterium]MBU4073720.1 hypothetical protein [Patescibacteria group bacterium]
MAKKERKNKIKNKEEFQMPEWMECAWRRVPCDRDDCKICGKIKRERARHIAAGENPDDMSVALEDVGNDFKEMLSMIKADAAAHGFDIENIDDIQEPPEPNDFPFYNQAAEWSADIHKMAEQAYDNLDAWPELEPGLDLLWYSNTILAKIYRQLCNRWHIEQGDEYGEEDYKYTKYVLGECLAILKKSLGELITMYPEQKGKFNLSLIMLSGIEEQAMKI